MRQSQAGSLVNSGTGERGTKSEAGHKAAVKHHCSMAPRGRPRKLGIAKEGDRSHLPREERAFTEFHPFLNTYLGLVLVRQLTVDNPRQHSRAQSLSNGHHLSHQPSLQFEVNIHTCNGHHSYGNGSSVADDVYALNQISPDQLMYYEPSIHPFHGIAIDPALENANIDPMLEDEDPHGTRLEAVPAHAKASDRMLRSEVSVEERFERAQIENGFTLGVLHKPVYSKLESSPFEHKVKLASNAIAFGYQANTLFERPDDMYIRTIDIPESDLADRVEYDMDEQDDLWLQEYNARRKLNGLDQITREIFEITLTKIEKEWTALEKRIPRLETRDVVGPSEDSKCAICDDGECENTNAIVFCDGCNLAVHQECYGVPYIPEGQWLCRKCFASPINPVSCLFCPSQTGAFKQTSDLRWAHLLCTAWIPEVTVGNPIFMEPIEGMSLIPASRYKLLCYICKLKIGACIQCSNKHCFVAFHVSCARRAKLFLQTQPGVSSLAQFGKAFCDRHVPDWYRAEVDVNEAFMEAQSHFHNNPDYQIQTHATLEDTLRPKFTISLKKAKQSAAIPNVVFRAILSYMQKFRIRNKPEFIAKMCKYWSLKRRARRGASLLRRLQLQADDSSTHKLSEDQVQRKLEFVVSLDKELDALHEILTCLRDRESTKLERTEMRDSMVKCLYLPTANLIQPLIAEITAIDKEHILDYIDSRIPASLNTGMGRVTWQNIIDKANTKQYADIRFLGEDLRSVIQYILEVYTETASPENKLAKTLEKQLSLLLQESIGKQRSLKLHPVTYISQAFVAFEPTGLSLAKELPFNYAVRDLSPLSELDEEEERRGHALLFDSTPQGMSKEMMSRKRVQSISSARKKKKKKKRR